MAPSLRKLALTVHVVSSVGWLGSVAAFLALAVTGLTGHDSELVRAAYLAMDLTARFVIVPAALAALVSGLVSSLGTAWGLFRHYWVLVKFLLTVSAVIVLLLKLGPIRLVAGLAAGGALSGSDLREIRLSLLAHAAGGLLVLLAAATLGVFKPRGMTPYGRRRQREERGADRAGLDSAWNSGAPRWVKVGAIIAVALVVLALVVLHLAGRGPGGH
ncbi:MAG TPA: hypothetical protein VNM66_01970 [Thermodesulfobacteriota bacterium]|nr:hypothetical protein [Thermodesulfobacteriota bacterium]